MSARGSTAKISSLSSMSPPLPASRVCTLTFILAFLAFVGVGGMLDALLGRGGLFIVGSLSGIGSIGLGGLGGLRLGGGAGFLLGGDRSDFLVARKRRNLVNRCIVDQAGCGQLGLVDLRLLVDQTRRIGSALVTRELDGIADGQPRALVAGDRALDEQQPADRVRADDFE